jgi:LPXTG-motif cell wall-anchored protein
VVGSVVVLAGVPAFAAAPSPPAAQPTPTATPVTAPPVTTVPATTPAAATPTATTTTTPPATTPAPVAALRATSPAVAGAPLLLDASASTPADGIRSYEWTVASGASKVRTVTATPLTFVRPAHAGPVRISLRVTDAQGRTAEAAQPLALMVGPAPQIAPPAPQKTFAAKKVAVAASPKAHAAAATSVTIKDFSFGPASVTIHAGDTVTWTNVGPTDHNATASNGSFATGNMKKGATASHTFATAGTFAYICSLHPFMTGKVTVLAAAAATTTTPTTTTPSSTSSSTPSTTTPSAASPSATATPTAAATPTGPQLPVTGAEPAFPALAGAGLIAAGLYLRRRARVQP